MKVYYDKDADLSVIKKLKVTIVGYDDATQTFKFINSLL